MGNIGLGSVELFAETIAHVSNLLTNEELQAWTPLCEKYWTQRKFAEELIKYLLRVFSTWTVFSHVFVTEWLMETAIYETGLMLNENTAAGKQAAV